MDRTTREMLSVGIDVGTTTTQVVFSRLKVRNTARPGLVPRIEIDARAVEHVGAVAFTPLLGPDEIDADSLLQLVRQEYAAAGIDPMDVETGAVIITGETARRSNADQVLTALSGLAGDFVVTVAGPNLEAQIAARGSGAAAWSADNYTTVVNVDIGGGSSNAAVFRSGKHLASSAAMVGGRGIEVESTSGLVSAITPAARRVIDAIGARLEVGGRADVGALREVTDRFAVLIVDLILGVPSPLLEAVALTLPFDRDLPAPAAVFLSGGVGRCYYEELPAGTIDEIAAFGDVGPLLARSLRLEPRLRAMEVRQPTQTLNATVIGAASQTVTMSGTTIWVRADLLPLRDLPVVQPDLDLPMSSTGLAEAVRLATRRWDAEGDGRVAIALDLPDALDYSGLSSIAAALADYATGTLPPDVPLVVVTEEDYAQVLGQTVQALRPGLPVITIDQIGLGEGDFIDIGRPLLDGRAVPVSVKTLVFDR
jgi:ethanolamine utilization protein EutA